MVSTEFCHLWLNVALTAAVNSLRPAMLPFSVWRLVDDEHFLAKKLPGYPEYQKSVRHRLTVRVATLWTAEAAGLVESVDLGRQAEIEMHTTRANAKVFHNHTTPQLLRLSG
jgi:hypothetical protein